MARPQPNIIVEYCDQTTYQTEQVLEAGAIYAVFHQGKPINLRTLSRIVSYPGPKYKKCSFSNPGHALNLAERLNRLFKTTDFEVYRLDQGKLFTGN